MTKCLVSLLLLTTITITSCNIFSSILKKQQQTEPFTLEGQLNNILSSRNFNRMFLKSVLCKESTINTDSNAIIKLCAASQSYDNTDNNQLTKEKNENKNYNNVGFRKDQWHNYPKQMDRLDLGLYNDQTQNVDFGTLEDNDNDRRETSFSEIMKNNANEIAERNVDFPTYETFITSTNPLLILNLRSKDLERTELLSDIPDKGEPEMNVEDLNLSPIELDHVLETTEKTQDGKDLKQDVQPLDSTAEKKNMVKKRLFSLWSRLQSLSPKGHELQHRRHLYAYYGLPDAAKNGILTAETRATLMRPPGSPLRWG